MHCPICGEYGDLVRARVRKTGQQVIVCTECDFLDAHPEADADPAAAMDVASFLAQAGLEPGWDELEIIERLARP